MRFRSTQKTVLPVMVCLTLAGCFQSSEERAAEHHENAIQLVADGDTDRAIVEFRNALRFEENNPEIRRGLARVFLERGNNTGAYQAYLGIAELLPDDLEARVTLSEIAFSLRSWDEFEKHAEIVIEQQPEDARVKALEIALRYRNATLDGDTGLSNTIVTEAEGLAVDLPDSNMLRQILIDGYVKQKAYDKALVQLDKSIEAAPADLLLYNGKLELLSLQNKPDELEAELRRMVPLFPDDQNIKSTLLRYLMARGKADEAEEFLREVMTNAPDKTLRASSAASLVQFILQTKGDTAALAELNSLLSSDTATDTLRALRGTINFDSGKRAEGISELQDLLAQETTDMSTLERQNVSVALAKMLVSDGNEVGARKLVEEILADDANAVGALKMQARWLIREDDTAGAINAMRTALDQAPQDSEAMSLMAQAYQRAGNTDLMLNFLSLAVEASNKAPEQSLRYATALRREEKPLQAETVLINALRITPGNADILTALGEIYLEVEDLPRAKQVVSTLRNINTEAAQASADSLNLEVLARESGAEEALGFLEELSKKEGATGQQAKLSLLRSRLQGDNPAAALDYAKELVAEEPDNLQFRNALALTYAALRDYPAAESAMRALLGENPQLATVWLQLARLKTAQDQPDAALAVIDEALGAVPDNPDLLWGKASFLQRGGDVDGAIAIYEDMYTRFSGSPVIANNLASLLSTYRNDEASIARAQLIARRLKDTTVPAFQDTYGWLQHLAGDSATALTYVEPAAASLPNDVQVQLHLGLIYAGLARKEDAITQLQNTITAAGPLGREDLIEQARTAIADLENEEEAQ